MEKAKEKIKVESDGNLIKIGDKWYQFQVNEDGSFKTGEFELIEIDKKKLDRKIGYITDKLFSFVDPKHVMKDALIELPECDVNKLYKFIKKKKGKAKPKVRKHCIRLDIGGVEIPIR